MLIKVITRLLYGGHPQEQTGMATGFISEKLKKEMKQVHRREATNSYRGREEVQ